MEKKELSVDEQAAVEDYRRVSRNSADEAQKLKLGSSLAFVLLDSNLTSREDILLRIQRVNGDAIDDSEEGLLELEGRLSGVSAHLNSLTASAERMSVDAAETAEHIERSGLPE